MTGSPGDVLLRLRRTPVQRLPRKLVSFFYRELRARARRWGMLRAAGELSDQALLRALGGRFGSVEEALAHFRGRREPRFFVDVPAARARAAALAARYPELADRTRLSAERVIDHLFDLLGSGPVQLGATIDWHTDFKTGIAWPREPLFEEIDYARLSEPCDVKVPWELSRCHQLVTLGRAYALEGDPRYAREAVAQLESWLDANPWPRGVNWGRAMEVALRAVNWIWMAALLDDAPELTDRVRLRLLKALLQHGRHILDNLEESDNNGNHYLSNGVGLLFLGVLYPELREAARWRQKGCEIVWGEIERQVSPDGVDFEKGIGYQGLVLEFWYSAVLLSDLNGIHVPEMVRERLARMFDFVLAYTRPDGTFPQVGDNDDGRLAGLDDEPVGSHQRHLAVGGAMLNRPDLLHAAGTAVETAVWLMGEQALEMNAEPGSVHPQGGVNRALHPTAPVRPQPQARADAFDVAQPERHPTGTVRPEPVEGRGNEPLTGDPVHGSTSSPRTGGGTPRTAAWGGTRTGAGDGTRTGVGGETGMGLGSSDAPVASSEVWATVREVSRGFPEGGFYVLRGSDCVMLVDAGEVGMNGIGGHGHNDLLSFDLWAAGAPLIVDSGTFVYTADPAARQWFRSTAAHNTVRVDGQEIARLGDERWLWRIEDDAHPTVHEWRSDEGGDLLDVEHDGYQRLAQPVRHRRRIRFARRQQLWLIEDELIGAGEHELELFFHSGVALAVEEGMAARLEAPRGDLLLVPLRAPSGVQVTADYGWISRAYGHRERAPVLKYSAHTALPARFVTGLALAARGTPLDEARSSLEAMYEKPRGERSSTRVVPSSPLVPG